jgi:SPP1 gp7 family putative phage head morphogenesis protein
MRPPIKQLDILMSKSTRIIAYLLADALYSLATGNKKNFNEAQNNFGEAMRRASAFADILGRKKAAQEIAEIKGDTVMFAKNPTNEKEFTVDFDFNVPFDDALDHVGENNKIMQQLGWLPDVKSAYSPHNFYNRERRELNFIPVFKDSFDSKINEIIIDDLAFGREKEDTLKKIAAYTQGKADTVYRKKIAEAYTGGRLRSLKDGNVQSFVKGVLFNATEDRNVRPDHWALDGFVFAPDSKWLQYIAPPIYYNCRCAFQFVGEEALKRLNGGKHWKSGQLVESDMTYEKLPSPRFNSRPDLRIYS